MDDTLLLATCVAMAVHSIRGTVHTLLRCSITPLAAPLPPPQPLQQLYARRVQHSQIEASIPREIPLHDFSCVDMSRREWTCLVTPHHFEVLIRDLAGMH